MNQRIPKILIVISGFGGILFTLFSIFSYSLTAPNLVISNWQPYWEFQLYMWKTFFNNRDLLGRSFVLLGVTVFSWYYLFVFHAQKLRNKIPFLLTVISICTVPLLVSSTALSYDVYNYMFNAKMVLVYESNPHVKTAIEFTQDDWLRFMHNVHTPAPYGYGWTALSLVPFSIAEPSFVKTWMSFRIFSLISFIVTITTLYKFLKEKDRWLIALFALHPLVLIEVISSVHNDLWMMFPALLSLGLQSRVQKLGNRTLVQSWILTTIISALLLIVSITIKLATIALIPVWAMLVMSPFILIFWHKQQNILQRMYTRMFTTIWQKRYLSLLNHWPEIASALLFLPLILERSKWFLPWYIIWSLVWLPLFNFKSTISRIWASWILAISTSVFFRYVPYLLNGSYTESGDMQQLVITWIGAILLFPCLYYLLRKAML